MWIKITSQNERAPSKISIKLSINKHGKGTVFVGIASPLAAQLGFEKEPCVNAFIGEEKDAGLLWLQPSAEGFKVGHLKKAYVVRLPVPPGVLLKATNGTAEHSKHPDGGITIVLPEFLKPAQGIGLVTASATDKPGGLELNGNMLSLGSKTVLLLKHEVAIMKVFIDRFGEPVSKDDLFEAISASDPTATLNLSMMEAWIAKLRGKFDDKKILLAFMPHRGVGWDLRRARA